MVDYTVNNTNNITAHEDDFVQNSFKHRPLSKSVKLIYIWVMILTLFSGSLIWNLISSEKDL